MSRTPFTLCHSLPKEGELFLLGTALHWNIHG